MSRTINQSVVKAILRMYEDGILIEDIESLLKVKYDAIIIIVWAYKIGKKDLL